MTKLINYAISSFCILNGSQDILSAKGDLMTNSLMRITITRARLFDDSPLKKVVLFLSATNTKAVMSGSESYESLQISYADG